MAQKSKASRASGSASKAVEHYFQALDKVQVRGVQVSAGSPPQTPKVEIGDELAREQKIKNDNAEQDIALKRQTLNRLFGLLGAETGLVFLFTLFQATAWPRGFHLADWSFRTLVSATILQITAMLFAAVNYLFPKGHR